MICINCQSDKDISCFEHQRNRPNPRKICKTCRQRSRNKEQERVRHRAYMKERRAKNPTLVRQIWERSVYGVCKEDFPQQNCYICSSTKRLCIDHNHLTGEVRGLLCTKCNGAIGMFDDDPDKMSKAIRYLKDGPHFQLP